MTSSILPHVAIRLIRARHPDALVCIRCARLLATRRESCAQSNLTEAARLAYVCAECQQEQAEAERVVAARCANLERAREIVVEKRAARGAPVPLPASDEIVRGLLVSPRQSGRFGQGFVTRAPRDRQAWRRAHGGRPRKTQAPRRGSARTGLGSAKRWPSRDTASPRQGTAL